MAKAATTKGEAASSEAGGSSDAAMPPAIEPGIGKVSEPAAARVKVKIPNERYGNQDKDSCRELLFRVCRVLGVNPDADVRPVELLAWTYYGGDEMQDLPAAVSIVTAGGRKLKIYEDMSCDDDTVAMLARVFKIPPHADGSPWTAAELPDDLTLPTVQVTGMSTEQGHIYKKGYLKEGGKAEAARRQALKKPKPQ